MNFHDSPEQASFRAELRDWIDRQRPFGSLPHDDDERVAFLTDWQQRLAAGGWVAVSFPIGDGGRGLPPVYEAIVLDELSRAGAPPVWHYGYVARVISLYGTVEQRQRLLPPAFRGEQRWCQGFSEPDAGSDLASLTTRALRDGEQYVLDGQKVWTSEAKWAHWCLVLAKTEPDAPRYQSMSVFAVPLDIPGITIRPFRQITGSYEFAEVFFDGARVPATNRIGEPGAGWQIAMSTTAYERGPADVGFIVDFQRTIRQLAAAQRAGRLRDHPAIRQRLARSYVDVEVLRLHVLRGLSSRSESTTDTDSASVDKLLMTRTEQQLAHTTMDAAGASFVLGHDPAATHAYLWSRAASVYGGTTQIQRNIVATRILGLPR
jgi:alkylation response protein AidB-like acyl-CoA dehydrogenase